MEDLAYRNAMKRRKELQAEIDEIDRFLEQWKRYAGTEPDQSVTVGTAVERDVALPVTPLKKKLSRTKRAEVLREVIVEAGHPMTCGQIVTALDERDYAIGGTDANKNIGTIMWRLHDQFVNIEGHGYWPKDLPYRTAGYHGDTAELVGE